MRYFVVLVVFCLTYYCDNVNAGVVPDIPCPNIFEYVFHKTYFQGKITLPEATGETIEMVVEFSQPSASTSAAAIFLNETEAEILQGKPIVYMIDFPNMDITPKLLRIIVNGVTICSAFEYYSNRSVKTELENKFKLQHKFYLNKPVTFEDKYDRTPSVWNEFQNPSPLIPEKPDSNPIINEKPPPTVIVIAATKENEGTLEKILEKLSNKASSLPPIEPRFSSILGKEDFSQTSDSPIITQTPSTSSSLDEDGQESCGQQKVAVTPFVFGETQLKRGQMPWISAIYTKEVARLDFLCSGSLVSKQSVITAAHCVVNEQNLSPESLLIAVGRYNLDDYTEKGFINREAKTFIVHPEYMKRKQSDADLALIILAAPVEFSDYIQSICLWPKSDDNFGKDIRNGYTTGWGVVQYGRPSSGIPKMVSIKIYTKAQCAAYPGYNHVGTSRTLCAGNANGTGLCLGDSGAGLVVSHENIWYLRAIVSGSLKTDKICNKQQFIVYCDIAEHTDWIRRNMIY